MQLEAALFHWCKKLTDNNGVSSTMMQGNDLQRDLLVMPAALEAISKVQNKLFSKQSIQCSFLIIPFLGQKEQVYTHSL